MCAETSDIASQPLVISGERFRREILGCSKSTFYALVKSGRIAHLRAVNLCTARRTFYVRAKAEAWVTETHNDRLFFKRLKP